MATTTTRRPGRAVAVRPAARPVRRRPVRRPVRVPRRRVLRRGRRQSQGWVIAAAGLAVLLLVTHGVAEQQHDPAPAAPAPAPAAGPPAARYTNGSIGCVLPDPTSNGCLTGATAHALDEIGRTFGGYRGGPKIHATGCWDKHAWNPSSEHPKGRACDLFPTKSGTFPTGAELAAGWELATWLRANAGPLHVQYVIWQGRIWSVTHPEDVGGGWGRRYTGGGIYDPEDATGGHYDHVHVSFQQ